MLYMKESPRLSVVIASLGRPGLTKILQDISQSSFEIPIDIILVLDGVNPSNPELKIWENMCSKIIVIPVNVGPSAAFTIGIQEVTTEFFRIFTDDDKWLHAPLKRVMPSLQKNTVLVCRSEVHDELGGSIRSAIFPISKSPLESVYAPIIPWRRNKVYFHLTSMIFPREVSQIEFRKELVIREDLDWLQQIFERGINFIFSPEVLVLASPSHQRSAIRQSVEIDVDWVTRLSNRSKTLAKNFVYFHCFRSFAVAGMPKEIFARIFLFQEIVGKPTPSQLFALIFYVQLSVLKNLGHKLSRK